MWCLTSDYYKLDDQLIVSVTRFCAFTRTWQQAGKSLGVLWYKTGIFAQFCRPFAKYTALRQLLIGV